MAYVTLTNGAQGQIFGYDSNNAANLTINLVPDNIKTTVQTLKAALAVASQMATAFGIDTTTAETSSASSSTTSSGTSGSTTSGTTVTSGGTASS